LILGVNEPLSNETVSEALYLPTRAVIHFEALGSTAHVDAHGEPRKRISINQLTRVSSKEK
jgi:hypothetical protein